MNRDRNCISYWLPKLANLALAGVRVPRTELVRTELPLSDLMEGIDETPDKTTAELAAFAAELTAAAHRMAAYDFPRGSVFLRSGQTSGKHDWDRTCNVRNPAKIIEHVWPIVEYSAMADFFGLPVNVWAVREMLPVNSLGFLPRYNGMPIVQELRYFVRGGSIECVHPYWPEKAVRQGMAKAMDPEASDTLTRGIYAALLKITAEENRAAVEMVQTVAGAFAGDGGWSVDVLFSKNGPYVTDMAEAERSYHWPTCPRTSGFKPLEPAEFDPSQVTEA